LTVNTFDKGKAYYIASRNDERFHENFYGALVRQLELKRVLNTDLPKGVTAQMRTDGEHDFVFLLNFQPATRQVNLSRESFVDMTSGMNVKGTVTLSAYGSLVLRRPHTA
jgi:beta-galactosidase